MTLTKAREMLEVTLGNVQIDNQMFCQPEASIVLYRGEPRTSSSKDAKRPPLLAFAYTRVLQQPGIDYYEYMSSKKFILSLI